MVKTMDVFDIQAPNEITHFLWLDFEMTGLDLAKDHVIEVACIVTDKFLNQVKTLEPIVIHQPKTLMDSMDAWCTEQHGKSGLTEAVNNSTISTSDAEEMVMKFIQNTRINPKGMVLAGNSVHIDREFLVKDMPRVAQAISYRIVDVSSISLLVKSWLPTMHMAKPIKAYRHRALDDIRESIAELQWYKNNVFNKN
jgi:oligoribonuclease